jgi:hypothetical protein
MIKILNCANIYNNNKRIFYIKKFYQKLESLNKFDQLGKSIGSSIFARKRIVQLIIAITQ